VSKITLHRLQPVAAIYHREQQTGGEHRLAGLLETAEVGADAPFGDRSV